MKSLVIYTSEFGNTARVANALWMSLNEYGKSAVKQVGTVNIKDLNGIDMLVIGSPTQGGMPTKSAQQFIEHLPKRFLRHTKVAVFDTRFEASQQKLSLRLLMKVIGFAAGKMARSIRKRGGSVIVEPKGFIVTGTEGPLKDGELEEAGEWASQLASAS